jgi:hypothetical protein
MSDTKRDLDFELTNKLASFITDLHASEINGEISWFFDNVRGAKIGDKLNGYLAEGMEFSSLGQATRWLCDRAGVLSRSEFAKEYLRTHPGYQPLTKAAEPASAIGAAISTGVPPSDIPPQPQRAAGPDGIAELGCRSLTLGEAAAAQVRLIVWCKACQHRFEPDTAELAKQHGAETTVLV